LNEVPLGKRSRLNIGIWGKNLTDEEFEITAIDNLPHSDRSVIWGDPLSYGIDLIFEY
jgi:iron complex outermembrane receptor protein